MNTQFRTLAKRRRALARSRRISTVDSFYDREPDLPSPKAVRNYYMKVGVTRFLISCTSRPDEGLRAQFAKRKDVIEASDWQREKFADLRHYRSKSAERRAAA
jgi:hypothetical protein